MLTLRRVQLPDALTVVRQRPRRLIWKQLKIKIRLQLPRDLKEDLELGAMNLEHFSIEAEVWRTSANSRVVVQPEVIQIINEAESVSHRA